MKSSPARYASLRRNAASGASSRSRFTAVTSAPNVVFPRLYSCCTRLTKKFVMGSTGSVPRAPAAVAKRAFSRVVTASSMPIESPFDVLPVTFTAPAIVVSSGAST